MNDAKKFVQAALEASFYASPSEPGLSIDELVRLGTGFSKYEGEIRDAVQELKRRDTFSRKGGLIRPPTDYEKVSDFNYTFEGDPRRWEAFEFVYTSWDDAVRRMGRARASVDRTALIEKGIAEGFSKRDMELAVFGLLLDELMEDVDGRIKITTRGSSWARPSVTNRQRQQQESRYSQSPHQSGPNRVDPLQPRPGTWVTLRGIGWSEEPGDAMEVSKHHECTDGVCDPGQGGRAQHC